MANGPSVWRKAESWLFPVCVRKGASALNPVLELYYYRGRHILATKDAIYSEGTRYRPLVAAFDTPELRAALPGMSRVLVLGTGLASAVHILDGSGFRPHFTLVEIDKLVLDWAEEFLPKGARGRVRAVNDDAFRFLEDDAGTYDLIIVDIFFGRTVPERVTEAAFLHQCKAKLAQNGWLVLNYMPGSKELPGKAKAALEAAFEKVREISFGLNRVYVAR